MINLGLFNKKTISSKDWLEHIMNDLLPFWTTPTALGDNGRFPNYRLHNGDAGFLPNAPEWLKIQSNNGSRYFFRMQSRQIYLYSIAYHITGIEDYLIYAKKGVEFILKSGFEDSKIPITYIEDKLPQPDRESRTSQDIAYILLGLAAYYYITREPLILEKIENVRKYLIDEYFTKSNIQYNTNILMWVKKDLITHDPTNPEKILEKFLTTDKELVASLDQINCYLLLLAPFLDEEKKKDYFNLLRSLCDTLYEDFYNSELNIFWGKLQERKHGLEYHTDFGHTIKSFWMCFLTGQLLGDTNFAAKSIENAKKLLKTAFINRNGSWASCFKEDGKTVNEDKVWWIFAELDQMAATISLASNKPEKIFNCYLTKTYSYWLKYFVDKKHKEVWHRLDKNGKPDKTIPKCHHFKNGFHSMEHALIAYIAMCKLENKELELYFAIDRQADSEIILFKPYYFSAHHSTKEKLKFIDNELNDKNKYAIKFDKIYC